MAEGKTFKLYIDAYSPQTMPMVTLAAYMADFAKLLGEPHAVHFTGLAGGSTTILGRVEREEAPKVIRRLAEIQRGTAAKELLKLVRDIDDRLAGDDGVGKLSVDDDEEEREIITFPGRTRAKAESYGPFNQTGHLDGLLVAIGGRDDTSHARLLSGHDRVLNCETTRPLARDLARHLYEQVRVFGVGRWRREASGEWTLIRFRIDRFDVLDERSLRAAVTELRTVHRDAWDDSADALADLRAMRDLDTLP